MRRAKIELDELRSRRKIAAVFMFFGLFLVGFVKDELAAYSGVVITTLALVAVVGLCNKITKKISEL